MADTPSTTEVRVAPPVTEVAVAIEFDPIGDLGTVHLGRIAADWSSDYPKLRELPGLPPSLINPNVGSFQVSTGPVPLRLWLISEDENNLVQLQNDRLIFNWRRLNTGRPYPGHAWVKEMVLGRWQLFTQQVSKLGLGSLRPRLIEWTYVNELDPSLLTRRGLTFFEDTLDLLPGVPDSFAFQISRKLVKEDRFLGYLLILGAPNGQAPQPEGYGLHITTKLDVSGQDPDDLFEKVQEAHDYSHAAFDGVTSNDAQSEWGLN